MTEKNRKRYERKHAFRVVCGIVQTLLNTAAFYYVWWNFVRVHNQTGHLLGRGNLGMAVLIYLGLCLFCFNGLGGFKTGVNRKMNLVASQVVALFLIDFAELFISLAITGEFRFFSDFLPRYVLLFLVQAVVNGILASLFTDLYRKIFPPLHMLEIYGGEHNRVYAKMNLRRDKYDVCGFLSCEEPEDVIRAEIQKYDAVLINDMPDEAENRILKICFDLDERVYFIPKISDIIVKSSEEINLFDTPLYLCRNMGMTDTEAAVKRLLDILLSALALVVLSPVLLITAAAIKLNDGGPVFFRQKRCTFGGEEFSILKFRSMIVDAEKDGRSHPAGEADDRITKVGHVIRATRIDELPQLINILKGDMSIVGPRPERIEHVQQYTAEIPEFSFRQKVKGGLTGYAQVYGKYNTTALDKLKLDLTYIMNYSLLLDVQIIFETVKIIFQKESTEGFSDEQAERIRKFEEEHGLVGAQEKKDE